MLEDYQIRDYQPGEEQEIVQLLSQIFTEWKSRKEKAQEHWKWKYQDNPNGPSVVAVAETNEKIVGVGHDVYIKAKVGKKILKTAYGTDVAVHPEHRRKGLHTRMLDLRRQNTLSFGFRYGYTTNKIFIDSTNRRLREGDDPWFPFPIDINRYLHIQDIDLHLEHKQTDNPWFKKQGYKIKKWFSSLQTQQDTQDVSHQIHTREGINLDEAETLWDKTKKNYKFITEKNGEYLNWRYLDPRAGEYYLLSGYLNEEFSGYIVVSIDHDTPGYPMGNIIDLFSNGEKDVDQQLLLEAIKWLHKQEINAISAFAVKSSKISHLLESSGFLNRGDTLYSTYKIPGRIGVRNQDIEQINVNQIHLMYSDYYVK